MYDYVEARLVPYQGGCFCRKLQKGCYSQAIRNNEYPDINMPTERCSLPAFLFLDGLQNPILIAAAIYNAKNKDILTVFGR